MITLLRILIVLALFASLSIVFADEAAALIDCGKDCADYVATAVKNGKSALEADLTKCHKANDELKKERDETVASLKTELTNLKEHARKSGELEQELRDLNRELEKKYAGELEQQKAMLEKAHELAKKSQQEVIEAKMEILKLSDSLGNTRINLKLIWEDTVGLWKKVVDKFKKDHVDQTKSEM